MATPLTQEAVLDLLIPMLRFDTTNPPGNEKPLAAMLAGFLQEHGVTGEVVETGDNRANVIARLKGSGERKALLLNGHLDVVPTGETPWKTPPFEPRVENGKLYARGAADMKSGFAAMIVAALAVRDSGKTLKGDLILCGTADEEVGNSGAQHFKDSGGLEGVGAIIVGEPSSCRLNIAEKGALWLEVSTTGRTAHGAFPDQGVNAVMGMHCLMAGLDKYRFAYTENPLLAPPTMTVTTIQGGVTTNVVPDRCVLTLDIRTVPGMEHADIIKDINRICEQTTAGMPGLGAAVRVLHNCQAVETPADHPFVRMGQAAVKELTGQEAEVYGVSFFTDVVVFLPGTDLPAILYGPGDAAMAHQPDECVPLEKLEEAARFYAAMIERYLID